MSTSEMGPAVGQPQKGGAPGCIRRPGLSLRAGARATGSHELCLAQVRGWHDPFSWRTHTCRSSCGGRGLHLVSPSIAAHLRLGQDLSLSLQLTDELDLQVSNAQGPCCLHLPRAGVTGMDRGA